MKTKLSIIILMLFGAFFFSYSQSSMFLGTPDHLGIYSSEFPEKIILRKIWSLKTGGKIFGTAAIADKVVYFGSDDSCLYSVETNGNLKWKIKLNGKIRSTPAVSDTLLYINDYSGKIYSLYTKDGSLAWKFETEGDARYADYGINGNEPKNKFLEDPWDVYLASPVYKDSVVYFACGKNIYALNFKTGEKYWSFKAANIIHSSPALSNGKLYFGCWDSKLYALDAKTGAKIWDFQTGTDPVNHLMSGIQSSPTVVDSFVFIGSRDANVYALHAITGKQIWKQGFGGSWMPSSFTVVNDTIYTGSSDAAGFFALNKKDGKIKYSIKFPSFGFSTPAYSNGTIFMGCANGSMFCIDAVSRKIKASFDTDGHKHNYLNALLANGTLNQSVFPNSIQYEENLRWCEILFSTGSVFTSPVIADNIVFFGSTDSCFYAIEDDGSTKPDFKVSAQNLNFNTTAGVLTIDTSINITNLCENADSFAVNVTGTYAKFVKGVVFEPVVLKLNPAETGKIRIHGSLEFPKPTNQKTSFGIYNMRNEYIQSRINVEFKVVTSTKKLDKAAEYVVYPNPVKDILHIQTDVQNAEISVFNNMNQKVREMQIAENGAINLGELSAGVYFLQVKSKEKTIVKSFIKL